MNTNYLTVKAKIRIDRHPTEVFDAFVDAHAMSQFWFTRRDDGLKAGEPTTWFLGSDEGAFSFEVQVRELNPPHRIVIEWEGADGTTTQVIWTIEAAGEGESILTIEESGFSGSPEAIIARALESTGGFNQVVVAAKAYLEHGISLNVVAAHV